MKSINENYHVIGLSTNDLASGVLTLIADSIRNAFFKTGEDVRSGRLVIAKENWSVIKFNSNFYVERESESKYINLGYEEILFINESAWSILKRNGIRLNQIDEIKELPNDVDGTFISMPYWE